MFESNKKLKSGEAKEGFNFIELIKIIIFIIFSKAHNFPSKFRITQSVRGLVYQIYPLHGIKLVEYFTVAFQYSFQLSTSTIYRLAHIILKGNRKFENKKTVQ